MLVAKKDARIILDYKFAKGEGPQVSGIIISPIRGVNKSIKS